MAARKSGSKPPPMAAVRPRKISTAWPGLAVRLAQALGTMSEDQYLIISIKGTNRVVQFAAQGSWGTRAEVVGNQYLPRRQRLDGPRLQRLRQLGWEAPTGSDRTATPENDPDGSPNYFVDWPATRAVADLAELAVRTFVEILDAPHPGWLEYEAFGDDHCELTFPELGLKRAPRTMLPQKFEELAKRVLGALREITGLPDLDYDDEHDIAFSRGSSSVSVTLATNLQIRVYMLVLIDVESSPALLERLNGINEHLNSMHLAHHRGDVFVLCAVPGSPFEPGHLAQALAALSELGDGLGDVLQAEFGGALPVGTPVVSVMKH